MAILSARTAYGIVTGKKAANPEISDFLGIPYAKPPVGELRFSAPLEPEPWEDERACTKFGPSCIQPEHPDMQMDSGVSEDCLYLNIYTPAERADLRLPVMFWIHGGGFTGGSSADPEMSGEKLAEWGVVVVTINYRCGVLGFLALPELTEKKGSAVNAGVLDQIAALRWVKHNIEAFGGDPERILVFGQSSGGMSTRMLLTSPLSRGLFSRAIVESGGGLNEADPIRPKQEFMSLCQRAMEHLGWTLEDLMTKDAMEVNEKMMQAARETVVTDEVGYFQPFIDEYSILEVPGKLIAKGEYMDIPIICGTVAGDSWMFSRKVRDQLTDQTYFRGFSYAASQAWANLQTEQNRTPIYTFYMDRRQPKRPMNGYRHGAPPFGADTPHGTEVAYVFGTLDARSTPFEPFDYEMSRVMQNYWTNFAKYGNPNGEGLAEWPPYTKETPYAMHFGQDSFRAEDIVHTKEEAWTLEYTKKHPGLLTSLQI